MWRDTLRLPDVRPQRYIRRARKRTLKIGRDELRTLWQTREEVYESNSLQLYITDFVFFSLTFVNKFRWISVTLFTVVLVSHGTPSSFTLWPHFLTIKSIVYNILITHMFWKYFYLCTKVSPIRSTKWQHEEFINQFIFLRLPPYHISRKGLE